MGATSAHPRLASLDILRGLDLFVLLFFQPVLVAVGRAADLPWLNAILYQFDHEVWQGFRLWDIVMPLFLFMVGASMPFSFAKYSRPGQSYRPLYKKILRRVLLLFLLGIIVQGNLLGFSPDRFYVYNNTLQAIAAGYLIAAMILLHLNRSMQVAATVALLVIYTLPMAIRGDYSPEGNFAYTVDLVVLGPLRGDLTYTWVWSSLTFGVTVMMGAFAGRIIKESPTSYRRNTLLLAVIGVAAVVAGLIAGTGIPIIKRLWTSSMALYSGGICFLLMALTHYLVDGLGLTRGASWLKIYGMNAIAAYVIGEVVNFRSVVASVTYGLEPLVGSEYYEAVLTLGNSAILLAILALMYRHKYFLKV